MTLSGFEMITSAKKALFAIIASGAVVIGSSNHILLSNKNAAQLNSSQKKPYVAFNRTLNDKEIYELYLFTQTSKFADFKTLKRIVYCESSFRQYDAGHPLRGIANPHDIGLFQISETYHLKEAEKLGYDIYTWQGNIDYGLHLYRVQGKKPWNPSRPCWSV